MIFAIVSAGTLFGCGKGGPPDQGLAKIDDRFYPILVKNGIRTYLADPGSIRLYGDKAVMTTLTIIDNVGTQKITTEFDCKNRTAKDLQSDFYGKTGEAHTKKEGTTNTVRPQTALETTMNYACWR